jgi:xylulokinase
VVLVFDIGTSVLKGGIIDNRGDLLDRAQVPVHLTESGTPLYHEADAESWISSMARVVSMLDVSGRKDIRAVVVSGNGPTLVPVGRNGRPLDSAMTWMDRRGVKEAEYIAGITGEYVDPTFYLPKAYWIYKNSPRVYKKTRYFLSCPEFIDFVLTGNAFTVLPSDQFTRYIWTEEVLKKLKMDLDKFPPFIKPGQLLGEVRAEAQKLIGIPSGTRVFAGGPDFIMTLLGTATVEPGRACDRAGTSEGINLCSRIPLKDPRLMSLPHIVEGFHNISGIISTSGKALEWCRAVTGRQNDDFETLFEKVRKVPPGSKGLIFLPYLAGERAPLWDPYARGCFIGLSTSHRSIDITRAVVESIGFAIRDVIEVMLENKLSLDELRVTGGQARSTVWNQIKADITGKRILVTETGYSELIGDACVALYALGEFATPAEASENIVKIKKVYTPGRNTRSLYDELFSIYRESYKGLKDIFASLSRLQAHPSDTLNNRS